MTAVTRCETALFYILYSELFSGAVLLYPAGVDSAVPYPAGRQLYLNTYAIDLLPTLEALSSQHPRHNSSRAHTSGCER